MGHCRFYAICSQANAGSCASCRQIVEALREKTALRTGAKPDESAVARDVEEASAAKPEPGVDMAWMRRGAGLCRSTGRTALKMKTREQPAIAPKPAPMPPVSLSPGAHVQTGTKTFAEFCDDEIGRIDARLSAVRQAIGEAQAHSAVHSERGDTSLALQYDVRAKMLTLEEGLLTRALERWEKIKRDGQLGQRY